MVKMGSTFQGTASERRTRHGTHILVFQSHNRLGEEGIDRRPMAEIAGAVCHNASFMPCPYDRVRNHPKEWQREGARALFMENPPDN